MAFQHSETTTPVYPKPAPKPPERSPVEPGAADAFRKHGEEQTREAQRLAESAKQARGR